MTHAALLALAAAITAAAALAVPSADAPAEGQDGGTPRVELEVAGILPMPEGSSAIVVLREKGSRTLLPLIVPGGMTEGKADARGGLLGRTIEALGGRVAEVEIDRAEETRAGSRVRLTQGTKKLELHARPSESVALAMAAKVPIVTTRRVLEQAGLSPEDLARVHSKVNAGDSRL